MSIVSCSSDSTQSSIKLNLSAVNPIVSKSANSQKTSAAVVVFTDFRISIRDIVFKNDDDDTSTLDTGEIQFTGPYQIDLLNNSVVLSQSIGTAIVPDGTYKDMRLKFHKNEDLLSTDDLFNRSIYIEGTIDGVPFVFAHNTTENFDLGSSNGVLVQGDIVTFTLQFDISKFLNSFNQLDLSQTTDNNNDGVIEIFPGDTDGNQDVSDALKDNIKMAADLMN